jgi:imidazolonepropionase
MLALGTTTVEIKSGYGLTVADEVKLLEVAREFTSETTFLGAHVVPAEYSGDRRPTSRSSPAGCSRRVPRSRAGSTCSATPAPSMRARRGRYSRQASPPDYSRDCTATSSSTGPECGSRWSSGRRAWTTARTLPTTTSLRCATLDVVATLLPGADFATRSPYPDARALLDAGVTVALATDCNPGSSYVTSMPLCISLAVREMRMTPAEALHAATAGGAAALRRDDIGLLSPGAYADLAVLEAPNHVHLAYRPAGRVVAQVWKQGARVL